MERAGRCRWEGVGGGGGRGGGRRLEGDEGPQQQAEGSAPARGAAGPGGRGQIVRAATPRPGRSRSGWLSSPAPRFESAAGGASRTDGRRSTAAVAEPCLLKRDRDGSERGGREWRSWLCALCAHDGGLVLGQANSAEERGGATSGICFECGRTADVRVSLRCG